MSQYTASIQALYVAYFNRPADPGGLAYWETIVAASNGNTAAVSANFAKSAEYKAAYAGLGADATINQVYLNIFGRTVDRDGLNFWSPKLASGAVTIDQIVTEVAKGAQLSDKVTYENRTTASVAYTDALNADVSLRLAYSNAAAIVSAKSFLNGITTTDSLTAAIAPASLAANLAKMVVDSAPAPVVTTFTLTTGLDTIVGTAGNDSFSGGLVDSFSAFDNIDGGSGVDSMNVLTTLTAAPGGVTVKGVETLNINTTGAGYTINTSTGYTGLTALNVADAFAGSVSVTAAATTAVTASALSGAMTVVGGLSQTTVNAGGNVTLTGSVGAVNVTETAMGATAISINGGTSVNVIATGATGTAGNTITIGTATGGAPTGAVQVSETAAIAGGAAGGAITVKGGTTVSVTETATNSTVAVPGTATTATQSAVIVTGTATTTAVTVNQSVAIAAVAGTAAVAQVDTITVGGTPTAGDVLTATVNGTAYSVTLTAGQAASTTTAAAALAAVVAAAGVNTTTASATVTLTSATAGTPFTVVVANVGAATIADVATTANTVLAAGTSGLANGAVTITDVNAASLTAAGTITSVSLNSFGAATANSGALSSVTLAGTGTSFTQTSGALTTATATTEALNLNGVTTTGAVTLGAVPKTVNITSASATATAGNTLQTLSATAATAVNISGDKALTLTNHSFAAAAVITSTSTGAVTISDALLAGQKYVGGAGVDTITLSATGTTAITTGAGNDVVTYAGVMGTGGSVNAGDGTADVIVMTAAQADSGTGATSSAVFATAFTNFEVLKLSAATGGATNINMANAGVGVNTLDILGSTTGTLAVAGAAANFTLTERALSSANITIALAADTGTADNVNLLFKANDGFASTGATVISNVESLTITTTDGDTVAQTAVIVTPITAANAATVTVSGNMGISFIAGMQQTTLTSLDASGLTASGAFGGLTFTSGALAAAATVKGGAAGTNVIDFSAATKVVTYTGGTGADTVNFATATTQAHVITLGDGVNAVNGGTNGNGNMTITGGAGVDTIVVGSGNNTIIAGAGADLITVGSGANIVTLGAGADTLTLSAVNTSSAVFTTITDIGAGDIISNGTLTAFVNATGKLGAALTSGVADYQTFLNAAAGKGAGVVSWFQFGGDTYLVEDRDASASFSAGNDIVIKLTGTVDLSNSTLVNGGHALTIV